MPTPKPKTVATYLCPGCQRRVYFTPCLICEALEAKGAAGEIQKAGLGLHVGNTAQRISKKQDQ